MQTEVSAKWVPKGSAPRVKSKPGKEKVSYSGFVLPSTGELFTDKPDRFTYETTIASIRSFLSAYPLSDGEKYYLVMDNASWHRKAKRLIKENANGEYSDIKDNVVFVYLPPYSPDLNPIEQVWRITRRDAKNNRYFPDKETLERELDDYYAALTEPNEDLQYLCSFNF